MTHYIQFLVDENAVEGILVEVEEEEILTDDGTDISNGLVPVGVGDVLEKSVVVAQKTFSSALKSAISHNVKGLMEAVKALPDPPNEIEITFGLKATGEVGNVAVVKGTGETNYTVKLAWKR